MVPDLHSSGFVYLNLHLDYGLEKTSGWKRRRSDAFNDPSVNLDLAGVNILDRTDHIFDSSIADSMDTITNINEFKRLRGFGGLVYWDAAMSVPADGKTVQLIGPDGTVIETMTTDEDGWFYTAYVHKGKSATYTFRVEGYPAADTPVTVGGKVKFGYEVIIIGP